MPEGSNEGSNEGSKEGSNEGSNEWGSKEGSKEGGNEGSNEGGKEGTITCCGDMKTPCPQPKSQELDLPLVDEAMRSLLEHPDMKMQAPEHLQKSLSEPNLGHKDSQLPHPLRQTRRSARLPFQRRHMQAQAWRSSAEAFGQRQKSASLMDTRKQETMRTVHADCYRLCEQPDNQENRLMYQYLEQYAYVERKKRTFSHHTASCLAMKDPRVCLHLTL